MSRRLLLVLVVLQAALYLLTYAVSVDLSSSSGSGGALRPYVEALRQSSDMLGHVLAQVIGGGTTLSEAGSRYYAGKRERDGLREACGAAAVGVSWTARALRRRRSSTW